jgi:hypothetical protein
MLHVARSSSVLAYHVRVVRAFVSFFAALLLATRTAGAAAPPVHLEVEACPSLDAKSVQRIFSADLGSATTSESGPDVTEVTITCEGNRVTVRVRDPISRKTVKRSFDPKSFGTQAESRIVAIAASELVLASWAELSANPAPMVPPEGPPPSESAVETARTFVRERSSTDAQAGTPPTVTAPNPAPAVTEPGDNEQPEVIGAGAGPLPDEHPQNHVSSSPVVFDRVTAVVSFRSFFKGDGTLWGGGARFGRERFGVVSWALDALVENGILLEHDEKDDGKDEIQKHNATSVTVGGWLCFYAHAGPATFRAGGGLRAGVLTLHDGPIPAIWGWPMFVASQTLSFRSLVIDFSGEAGFASLSGKPSLQGTWVSGQVGLGIAL